MPQTALAEKNKPLTWREILALQEGVIHRQQALIGGMSRAEWRWLVGPSGRWQTPLAGVAVAHSGPPTDRQLAWVAVLRAGRGGALSGDAALVHFGVKRLTVVRHDVVVPAPRQVRPAVGELLTMQPHQAVGTHLWTSTFPTMRMANKLAATLHAAAWAPDDEQAEERLALSVQQRLTTVAPLRVVLAQMPCLPRHGLIAEVLDDIELGATAKSEIDFLRFCRRHGLPLPDQLQLRVRTSNGTRYLDARWSWLSITIEIDGAHHMWAKQWHADTLRSLELAVARRGTREEVHRVTRGMLRHHEAETAALLRRLLVPA